MDSIRPASTVPICLDVGTDNKKFLEDPLYLGLRQTRVPEAEMKEFMEEFMHEMSVVFPNLLIQFEDFATDKVCLLPYLRAFYHEADLSFRRSPSCLHSATATPSLTMIFRVLVPSFFLAS